MMGIEIRYVFSRNDIDFFIPVIVQFIESTELCNLRLRKPREVF